MLRASFILICVCVASWEHIFARADSSILACREIDRCADLIRTRYFLNKGLDLILRPYRDQSDLKGLCSDLSTFRKCIRDNENICIRDLLVNRARDLLQRAAVYCTEETLTEFPI